MPVQSIQDVSPCEATSFAGQADNRLVILNHPADGSEVRVTVPRTATTRDVQESAARQLGCNELWESVRLGTWYRSEYSFCKELVGPNTESTADASLDGLSDSDEDDVASNITAQEAGTDSFIQEAVVTTAMPDQTVSLTLVQALNLQRELCEGFSQKSFQQQLSKLRSRFPKATDEFFAELSELLLSVQSPALLRYGFEDTKNGVLFMINAINRFTNNPEIARRHREINKLLWPTETPSESTADKYAEASSHTDQSQKPDKVEVTLKHAIDGREVTVAVPSDATLFEVKATAAYKLSNNDVVESGRAVYRDRGNFTSIDDSEALGHRRELLFLGADLASKRPTRAIRMLQRRAASARRTAAGDARRAAVEGTGLAGRRFRDSGKTATGLQARGAVDRLLAKQAGR